MVPPRRMVRSPTVVDAVMHVFTLATVVIGLGVVAIGKLATRVRRPTVDPWNCRLV